MIYSINLKKANVSRNAKYIDRAELKHGLSEAHLGSSSLGNLHGLLSQYNDFISEKMKNDATKFCKCIIIVLKKFLAASGIHHTKQDVTWNRKQKITEGHPILSIESFFTAESSLWVE